MTSGTNNSIGVVAKPYHIVIGLSSIYTKINGVFQKKLVRGGRPPSDKRHRAKEKAKKGWWVALKAFVLAKSLSMK